MKAIVIGATGLVGSCIVKELLLRPVREILVFTRRPLPFTSPAIVNRVVDFNKINEWAHEIQGDVLFSALGTTLKAAGSKDAQYKVDHDFQYEIARAAQKNLVSKYVLISSVNADSKSKFFYLRMKGELDEKILNLNIGSVSILRPGPLKGHREKQRLNEIISTKILDVLPVPASMRPVDATQVASIAVKCAMEDHIGKRILEPETILKQKAP